MANNEWKIAVEGMQIAMMPDGERWADIIEPAPEYKQDSDAPNAEKQKIKLIVTAKLSDGRIADYYMNRTSARKVAGILGTDLSKEGMKIWTGKRIFWGKILDQMVAGQEKKVLYVTKVEDTPQKPTQTA